MLGTFFFACAKPTTSFPGFSLFLRERTMVAAVHVELCANKLLSRGRSSTKVCRLDYEILSGVGRNILLQGGAWVSELRANFFVGRTITLF